MSDILYFFLTVFMFLDCVILVLLVLLQLPKKEAGAGVAFGGGATDALFGAGSGNVLTKITKYSAGIFFFLAISMAVVSAHGRKSSGGQSLEEELSKPSATPLGSPAGSSAPATSSSSNGGLLQTPLFSNLPPAQTSAPSNAPATKTAAPATNK